jgi:hypothetical protein
MRPVNIDTQFYRVLLGFGPRSSSSANAPPPPSAEGAKRGEGDAPPAWTGQHWRITKRSAGPSWMAHRVGVAGARACAATRVCPTHPHLTRQGRVGPPFVNLGGPTRDASSSPLEGEAVALHIRQLRDIEVGK